MATGSIYQLYWLWMTGREIAAMNATHSVRMLLWPSALLTSSGALLWVTVASAAPTTRTMAIVCSVQVACWLAIDVTRATSLVQRAAAVERERWYRVRPTVTVALLLAGIAIGCAGVQPGDPVLAGGKLSPTERIFDVWAGGLLLPLWLLYLQHGLNEALRRMNPVTEEEQFFGAGGTHSSSQVAAIRARLAEHHAARHGSENLDIAPWVTVALAGLCTLVFAWQVTTFGLALSFDDMRSSGVSSTKFVEQGEWWRLITQHFVHFNVAHWALNMFALLMGGWMLERMLGHRAMALVIATSMIGATAVAWYGNIALFGFKGYETIAGGESGIGFGVIGALVAADAAAVSPGGKFGRWMMVLGGISSLAPGVGVLAHVGGFLGGAAAVWIVSILRSRTTNADARATHVNVELAQPLMGLQIAEAQAPNESTHDLPAIPSPPHTVAPWDRAGMA